MRSISIEIGWSSRESLPESAWVGAAARVGRRRGWDSETFRDQDTLDFLTVGTADGLLLYDSAGGEPLAYRLTGATGWAQIFLYRRVPASGTINVTVALTGIGSAYFDDIRIEPLVPTQATTTAAR